jgi:hypothetical protein
MKTQPFREFFARLFGPVRVFTLLILVILIYLLPFNSKSEFIQHNRQIVEVPNISPVLKSLYPEGAFASCGAGGTGTNCQTGCCSAGACVVCPPREEEDRPPNITATLNCPQPGMNGWCLGSLSIDLSAADPQGYSVLISGTFAGNPFACPVGNTTCSIPVTAEGEGTITYRVDSSSGLFNSEATSYKLDLTTPELNGSISGATGNNNWYRSNAILEIGASDPISGIASITTTVDGVGPSAYTSPITLTDGIHSVLITASDQAGNTTQITQTVQVDTLNPAINVALGGTKGSNDWYVSTASVTPTAADAGSGIASFEISVDGGAWSAVTGSSSLPDGIHTYKLRAMDNAGNSTETPNQTIQVDTIAPFIDMTDELNLGGTAYYNVEDYGSGLAQYRAVIEDDEERYQKIVWLELLSGNQFDGQIRWDGRFKDGTYAGSGEYFITLKITDAAGNKTIKSAIVQVNPLSILQDIPAFTPPSTIEFVPEEEDSFTAQTESSSQTDASPAGVSFGGESNPFAEGSFVSTVFGVPATTTPIADTPLDSSILWGVAATALVGFTLGNWEQERERERQEKQKALEEKRANTERRQKQKEYEDSIRKRREWEAAEEAYLRNYNQHMEDKMADFEAADDAKWEASQIAMQEQKRKEQEHLNSVEAARWAGLAQIEQAKLKEQNKPNWLNNAIDNAWNWAYNNQTDLSLATGVVVGAAALVLAAGVITAPVWMIVVGAVLITSAIVTAGTIAINNHFDQDWDDHLVSNLIAGNAATLVTIGAGLLLAQASPWISSTIVTTCTKYPPVCRQIGPILDHGEESVLSFQLAYYKWTDDEEGVATTFLELQMELADGDTPGNSLTREVVEQLAKLGPDAAELVGKYGSDVAPLLVRYGNDAIDIIGAYGDEGISLLLQHGKDAIPLVLKYGDNAVKTLDAVDTESASKLLNNLDEDVLEYAIDGGPDAVAALSRWSDDELKEFGLELALRSKKDAKVLEDIHTLINLGPIDPKHLTHEQEKLINSIAENSMQYSDEGQIVLGKWVDYGHGFTYVARETGSVHYNPHPDMWNLFGEFGDNLREDTAWLVNKQVIHNGIDKGLPFEYTLEGIPSDNIFMEKEVVNLIFSGASDAEIKSALRVNKLSIRWQELKELQQAGYEFTFDEAKDSFIFSAK